MSLNAVVGMAVRAYLADRPEASAERKAAKEPPFDPHS
jgi:hypothetical protein